MGVACSHGNTVKMATVVQPPHTNRAVLRTSGQSLPVRAGIETEDDARVAGKDLAVEGMSVEDFHLLTVSRHCQQGSSLSNISHVQDLIIVAHELWECACAAMSSNTAMGK